MNKDLSSTRCYVGASVCAGAPTVQVNVLGSIGQDSTSEDARAYIEKFEDLV